MPNARRSALYVALIGLGFAAAEASAVCPLGTRAVSTYTGGYKTTICVRTGSEVVDVTVEPIGGEGPGPLATATVAVDMTGSSPTGNPPAPCPTCLPPPKPPKSKHCSVSVSNDDGDDDGEFDKRDVPCQLVGDPNVPPELDSGGTPVNTLSSPDTAMKCNIKKAECHTKVEILPTGLTCTDTGTPAIDFTAKPDADNSFILTVDIAGFDANNNPKDIMENFGCYALSGRQYSCESFTTGSAITGLCGSGSTAIAGFIGATSSIHYCSTGSLPAGDLFCGI